MARRQSAASRSSSSDRSSGTGSRSGTGARGGPRTRSDGRVDVSCPQCAAAYRIGADMLDEKIECTECHRVFFAKSTVGKRIKPPDYTKVYVGFGIGIVAIIGLFILANNSGETPKKAPVYVAPPATFSVGTHPRTKQLVNWAQSISDQNQPMFETHSDLAALAAQLEIASSDVAAVRTAMQEHESARFLRDLRCESGELSSEADMTADKGSGLVFVTPKPDNDDYKRNTRGTIGVTFRMDGEQVKVTGWEVKQKPVWNPTKPMPGTSTFVPNKDIAKPVATEISDSGGSRTVKESQPTPVPHWAKATPEQQAMADQVVADVITSADNNSPGGLFNRATLKVRSDDDKKAVVPRALNAMFERYSDVNAHNLELSQLDRALRGWTGFAVNYVVKDSGDPATDKKERESCIRQWFGFWWQYHDNLDEFFDRGDLLDLEPVDPTDPASKKKKKS